MGSFPFINNNNKMGRKFGRAILGNGVFIVGMWLGFKVVDYFLWD